METLVSVIIPNYNSKQYIEQCIDSLKNQTFHNFDIIVVDNASKDDSAKIVEEKYPDVRLIRLSENFGFSRAVNEGISASKAEFVLLLNDDTKADEHFVEKMYAAISSDDKIFSASAKMVQMFAPEKLDGAGDLYSALGWAYARGKDKSVNNKRFNKPCDIFASCGGAAIYRKSILNEIGYFDEFNFAYLEDIDIGYRARIYGYRNVYQPEAVVYHVGSAVSGSRYNDFKVRLSARNNIYIVFKNMPIPQLILNLPILLIGFGIKAVFFTLKGYSRPYFSGLLRGYLLCGEGRKIRYDKRNFKNYLKIQIGLWINCFRRV